MAHKKLRRLAALTSALIAANSAVGVFAPCFAESDFTAYAAESTEIAREEYGVRIAKESDEVRHDYKLGDKLDLTGIEISGYYNTFNEREFHKTFKVIYTMRYRVKAVPFLFITIAPPINS